jgi:hypothetical protein
MTPQRLQELVDELNAALEPGEFKDVAHPGSRGGKYYIDAHGVVRYGTPPIGGAKPKGKGKVKKPAHPKKGPDPAKAAAQKARQEMQTASKNAKQEIRDIGSMADAAKAGYSGVGKVAVDSASANAAMRDAASKDPSHVYAVIKDGAQFSVVKKPVSALQGSRANALGRNATADRAQAARHDAQAQRAQQHAQAASDRHARQALQKQERDKARADARVARDAARAQRQAARDKAKADALAASRAAQAQRQTRAAHKSLDTLMFEYKEALPKRADIESAMASDFEGELRDTYRAFADDHDYNFSEHEAGVKTLLSEYYPELFQAAYHDARDDHDLSVEWDVHNPQVVKAINALVGDHVKGITDTTKETLKDLVDVQTQAGLSPAQLARLIVEQGITDSKSRAETIAITESATAYNHGALLAYKDAGVGEVTVLDGDGDAQCAAAHGQRWTVEKAQGNAIAHPRCRRAFAPVME